MSLDRNHPPNFASVARKFSLDRRIEVGDDLADFDVMNNLTKRPLVLALYSLARERSPLCEGDFRFETVRFALTPPNRTRTPQLAC